MVREHIINHYFSFSDVYFAYFVCSVHVWVKKKKNYKPQNHEHSDALCDSGNTAGQ